MVVAAAGVVHVVERHAVQQERHLIVAAAVNLHRLPSRAVRAADVLLAQRHLDARHQDGDVLKRAAGREIVDQFVGNGAALRCRLNVDQRALARHRQRLLDASHLQVDVDGRSERGGQHDPLADDGPEPGKRERNLVLAGVERDDPVLTLAVGEHDPGPLDKRRAGRFDRHAGKHRSTRIADRAGNLGVLC